MLGNRDSNDRYSDYWLDATMSLLSRPLVSFPVAELAEHLLESFELTSLSWEWRTAAGDVGCEKFAGDDTTFSLEVIARFHEREAMMRHPLMRWFGYTGDPAPQSVGRVPTDLYPRCAQALFLEATVPFGIDQQLSIPGWMEGRAYGAFVLTRPRDDFSDRDMELARRIQQLMVGLLVQVRAHGCVGWLVDSGTAADRGLTGTEVGVLSLLSRGYTASRIARMLHVSPRTVHKHLEHIYRKLGVSDRLMAVQVAHEQGLCDHTTGSHEDGSHEDGSRRRTSTRSVSMPTAGRTHAASGY